MKEPPCMRTILGDTRGVFYNCDTEHIVIYPSYG